MMSTPQQIAQQSAGGVSVGAGAWLVLGAADTGKTTLVAALANELAARGRVAIVDADVGQSHIGPPTTIGWAVAERPIEDISTLAPAGISFVGGITPVGHLLQFSASLNQCVCVAAKVADVILIDTPGFVLSPAAAALWWEVQRILQPAVIVAIRRESELSDILCGLTGLQSQLQLVPCPSDVRSKSPEQRRAYRQKRFAEYFRSSQLYKLDLRNIAVQQGDSRLVDNPAGRLVALRDKSGVDLAVGAVMDWPTTGSIITVKAPVIDHTRVSCLVIGGASLDLPGPEV